VGVVIGIRRTAAAIEFKELYPHKDVKPDDDEVHSHSDSIITGSYVSTGARFWTGPSDLKGS
jgi:hypothetical protein